jgi:hypothetical protein
MPDALVLQKGLWVCTLALQAALVLRILGENLLYGFRWFAAYLAAEVASGLVLIWTPQTSIVYVHAWNFTQPILSLLRLAVGLEVVRRLVRSRPHPRHRVLAATSVLLAISLAGFSLEFEAEILRASMWHYSVLLLNRAVWTGIAIMIALLWTAGRISPAPLDRNTLVHARVLFAFAAIETTRYMLVASSHGHYIAPANVASLALQCVLFILWISGLKTDAEIDLAHEPEPTPTARGAAA